MKFSQEIKIGGKIISEDNPCFIIAEAGVNHNGDINLAKKLIDISVEAGVDAVKFQTFSTDRLILKDTEKAEYQKKNTESQESQYNMLKKLELTFEDHKTLVDYCNEKGIIFLSTPYDEESADLLDELGVDAYKVASTDTTNLPFLEYLSKKNKPIILSTGMSYLSEVRKAVEIFERNSVRNLILLHCISNYPVAFEKANLLSIRTLEDEFKTLIGYSDHTYGVGVAPYAIPLGAKVIEKHFTLDKKLPGPDHKASLNPKELKECVQLIRKVEKAMGNGIKVPILEEKAVKSSLQKSLVAKANISKGQVLNKEMLTSKRPGTGISPLYIDEVIGRKVKTDIPKNGIIEYSILEDE
ncbi:N-acetylneuraminate synthase [Orenia metallireducens]|uniref:N-acetylneuraminate synthase n=1 Tax=Orenia metallireducens TaxID=1413210 RepID=A0A1C0AB67_9FIRM|nr:N-acetylneuraminate synthase [Orenia metallireducens]OCL27625.1 N-acetylneuraminate synthase [Orenia metallireducens]